MNSGAESPPEPLLGRSKKNRFKALENSLYIATGGPSEKRKMIPGQGPEQDHGAIYDQIHCVAGQGNPGQRTDHGAQPGAFFRVALGSAPTAIAQPAFKIVQNTGAGIEFPMQYRS